MPDYKEMYILLRLSMIEGGIYATSEQAITKNFFNTHVAMMNVYSQTQKDKDNSQYIKYFMNLAAALKKVSNPQLYAVFTVVLPSDAVQERDARLFIEDDFEFQLCNVKAVTFHQGMFAGRTFLNSLYTHPMDTKDHEVLKVSSCP